MRSSHLLAFSLLFSASSLAAAVTGWVMTPDGRPIAEATVTLSRYESRLDQHQRLLTGTALEPLATSRSNSKGAFTIEAQGEVLELRVTAPGHGAAFRRVTADDEVGALILPKAPMRTGVVRFSGKPVAGATVIWMIGGTEFISKTDEAGRYSAPDSEAAAWRAVIHPEFAIDHQVIRRAKGLPWDVSLVRGTSVSARVVGFDGAPVNGARVVVDGWPSATTAEDGTFTVPHIPPSWRTMVITAWGLAGLRHSGGKLSGDIPLRRTATLSGTVIDAKSGKPVPGAIVFASGMAGAESVQADAKGRYVLTVRAGQYRSSAFHPAYWATPEMHELIPGSSAAHDPGLMPLARINGIVTDEKKEAVVGASVHAAQRPWVSDGRPPISSSGGFSTGPDGRFSIRVRNGSQINVIASKTGLPRGRSEELEVAAGEVRRDVSIVIPRGHLVTGRVSDPDGGPLSGVTVVAGEVASNSSGFWYTGGIRTPPGEGVETKADGTFSMRVQEGTFDLVFRRAGLSTAVARAVAVSAQTEPVEMTMTPSIDIAGRVVQKGAAVAGALVSASQGVGHASASTEPDGSFVLADLRKGPARISITMPESYLSESRTVEAPASDVLIELPEGGRIRGRVIDKKTRQPIPTFSTGISITHGLNSTTSGPRRTTSSDDGSFTIDGIGAGLVKVLVTAVGFAPATSPALTMEEGKSIDGIEIEMEQGVRLTGRVTAPDGSPLFGAMVHEVQLPGSPGSSVPPQRSSTTTDASGEYTFHGVAAGEKSYEFLHADYVSVRKDVKLAGSETRLDAQLEEGVTITGVVVTEGGEPVVDAQVATRSGQRRETRSTAGGAFTLRRLKPGRQTFVATKEGFAEGSLRDVEVKAGQQIRITMPAGCTIRGRVTGLEAADLALVTVTAAARGGSSMHSSVDRAGNYRIDGAAPGRVHLSARLNLGTTIRSARPVEIQVAAGETGQADLDFSGGATITGRVTRAGRPIPGGAMVRFDRRPAGSSSSVVTNQDGTYSASGLDDGDYSVNVANDQSVPLLTASYTVRGSGTFDIDLKSSTIRGRVIDASTGGPVQEPRLQLRPEASPAAMMAIRNVGGDSLGAFVFESVTPGRYSLIAEKQGYASRSEPLTITESSQDQIEIRMSPVEGVRVKLVDAGDGKPVQGHVVVKDAQGKPVWTGGKAGSTPGDVQLFLEPGTYTATAQAPGYLTRDVLLTAPGSQTIALTRAGVLDIRSSSPTRRRLRIYDGAGRPYAFGSKGSVGPQAPVVVLPPAGLTLRNVPAGTYSIQLLGAKDAVVRTIPVIVVAGQTATIEI